MTPRRRVFLLLALAATACGSADTGEGGTWAGIYQVTYSSWNGTTCDKEGPSLLAPAGFFRLAFRDQRYGFATCSSPDESSCTTEQYWFERRDGERWIHAEAGAQPSGDQCALSYSQWTVARSDGMVRREYRQHREGPRLPESQCTTAEAERRGPSLACAGLEIVLARPAIPQ